MLLAAFDARRATVDADLLAAGFPNDEDAVLTRIREAAGTRLAGDDGVVFLPQTARARVIREENLYTGVRVTMHATIATATVKVQLDINFGDPVTPGPQLVDYPTLRDDHPPMRILGYPMATVIAEKLCTAIDLGDASTRVRDYADLWILSRRHDLDAIELRSALTATATHRGVDLRPLSAAVGDLAALRSGVYDAFLTRMDDNTLTLPKDLANLLTDVIAYADPLLDHRHVDTWSAAARSWNRTHG